MAIREKYEYGRCLQEATRDVQEGILSLREASAVYGVSVIDIQAELASWRAEANG